MPYQLRRVYPFDRATRLQVFELLEAEGLSADRNLDYTVGLFDDTGKVAATGSFYRNTLRCLAVDSALQGEGLMAQIVSHLVEELFSRGQSHLFVYTKKKAVQAIAPLGFYEIAATDQVVFLENRKEGFGTYLAGLTHPITQPARIGAVVMNANPFSLGHQYLAEQAAARCDALHIFMVSEDVSVFPRAVREELIIAGTRHLPNVYTHPTGPYLVSSATFPSYFIRESDEVTLAQASIDAQVFGHIARALHITDRFVGEEPLSPSTALYNRAMGEELPHYGVTLHVLQRKSDNGVDPISATRIRSLLQAGRLLEVQSLVPQTTYDFLISPRGQAVIAAIK